MTDPDHLTTADTRALKDVRARCPELDATARNVCDVTTMMGELGGHGLRA